MSLTLSASETELRESLHACLAVPRFVDEVVAGRPYGSVEDLLSKARAAANLLTAAEVDQAMADHPRIGESAEGSGLSARLARREQQTSASLDGGLAAELAAGNAAYEAKFDRVFLIRAAGRSREEILAELNRRLGSDPATEAQVVATELRDITLLRIRQLFADVS